MDSLARASAPVLGSLDSAARGVGLAPTLQPIVALPTGAVVGFEALARWPSLNDPSSTDMFAFASAAGQSDVIKLDLHLVQHKPSRDRTRTLAAILAHHERTGAVILAEGIENDAHLEQALALGAQLAVALIAREWDDAENQQRSDSDRRFDFTVTYDRSLVASVARNLLDRMA